MTEIAKHYGTRDMVVMAQQFIDKEPWPDWVGVESMAKFNDRPDCSDMTVPTFDGQILLDKDWVVTTISGETVMPDDLFRELFEVLLG